MNGNTATILYVRSLIPVVAARGLSQERFLNILGLTEATLDDIDARVSKETVAKAWSISAELTGDVHLGLMASLYAPLGTFPALDHIAANMPTVGEGLSSIARYCRLCDSELWMRLQETKEGAVVLLSFPDTERAYSRHWAEWYIGLILSRARALSGRLDLPAHRVSLQHRAGSELSSLVSLLGCEPTFSPTETSISFEAAALNLPVKQASAFLRRVILRQAEQDLRLHSPAEVIVWEVKRVIANVLYREVPRIAVVAREIGCSVRTLQERLKNEGTSYDKLLDDVRRDLALQYVQDESIRLIEVPLLLRYSEPSPFHRAFRRWTGQSPLEARRAWQRRSRIEGSVRGVDPPQSPGLEFSRASPPQSET